MRLELDQRGAPGDRKRADSACCKCGAGSVEPLCIFGISRTGWWSVWI